MRVKEINLHQAGFAVSSQAGKIRNDDVKRGERSGVYRADGI